MKKEIISAIETSESFWNFLHIPLNIKLYLSVLTMVRSQRKKTILFGNFSQHGGGGLPKSQNFCKFTKYFFVCQIHSEVLKHVLQRGGGDI